MLMLCYLTWKIKQKYVTSARFLRFFFSKDIIVHMRLKLQSFNQLTLNVKPKIASALLFFIKSNSICIFYCGEKKSIRASKPSRSRCNSTNESQVIILC